MTSSKDSSELDRIFSESVHVKTVRFKDIRPYKNNPRKNDNSVEYVKNSIDDHGYKGLMVIDRDYNILAGHTRWKAARQFAREQGVNDFDIKVIMADDLDEEHCRSFRIADNSAGESSEWDFDLLPGEIDLCPDIDFTKYGFDLGIDEGTADDQALEEDIVETEGTVEEPEDDEMYTTKIVPPVYEPHGDPVEPAELADTTMTDRLLEEIGQADLPDDVRRFLELAAYRHTVFDYSKVAEFYARADEPVQRLMERSALVIVDLDSAIENGYVRMNDTTKALLEDNLDDRVP